MADETDLSNYFISEQVVKQEDYEEQEMSLVSWKKVSQTTGSTPRPRHGHRAIQVKDLILVLGGGNEGIIEEMHVYNTLNNTWMAPSVRGEIPPASASFGMIAVGTRIFTFGGMVEFGKYTDELYDLDTRRWEWRKLRPRTAGVKYPCARLGHSFVISNKSQKAYLFGGLSNDSTDAKRNVPRYMNDLFILDVSVPPNSLQWEKPVTHGEGPSPRESHSAVIYESNSSRKIVVFGGMNGTRLKDLWFLDLESLTWTEMEFGCGIPPSPRSLHTSVVINNKMYVFGGWVPLGDSASDSELIAEKEWKCTNSLGCFDLTINKWVPLQLVSTEEEKMPRARAGHCVAVVGNRMFVWSGRDGYRKAWSNQVCCRDMWVLEIMKPDQPGRVQLIRASFNSLDISWSHVAGADFYVLQIAVVDKPDASGSPSKGQGQLKLRGQQVVRVVKQQSGNGSSPAIAKPTTKAIIIAKEDGGVTQKVVYLANELADSSVSDPTKSAQQAATSLISTQGTTYTAPASAQATDEGGLPQDLFDDNDTSPPSPPKPQETASTSENEQKPEVEAKVAEEPVVKTEEESQLNKEVKAEDVAVEVKKEVDNELEQEVKTEIATADSAECAWYDIGLVRSAQCNVSHYFNQECAPLESFYDQYFDQTEILLACHETVPKHHKISLESGTSYKFRVAAVNGLGRGAWSEISTFKTCLPGFPSAPSSIRITKSVDGAQLTWEPPGNAAVAGRISEYSVYLAVKNSATTQESQLAFMRVYVGSEAECVVPQSSLQSAYVDQTNKPAIIFRIAARNEKGYGPATQVRWLQDQKPAVPARFPPNQNVPSYQQAGLPIKRARMD